MLTALPAKSHLLQHQIGRDRLDIDVGFPLDLRLHRDQEVLALDLQPVAGIIEEAGRLGARIAELVAEVDDRPLHRVLVSVLHLDHVEPDPTQGLCHQLRIIGRIGEVADLAAIRRISDHQRDARLGLKGGTRDELEEDGEQRGGRDAHVLTYCPAAWARRTLAAPYSAR